MSGSTPTPDGAARKGLLYVLVGAWNTAFGFGLFAALHVAFGDELHYLVVLAISWVVSVLEAFVAYRLVVFRVHGHLLRDLARFVTVYVGAFAFNLAALPFAVDVAGFPVVVAQALVVVVTVVLSFVLHSSFSFRRDAPDALPQPPTGRRAA